MLVANGCKVFYFLPKLGMVAGLIIMGSPSIQFHRFDVSKRDWQFITIKKSKEGDGSAGAPCYLKFSSVYVL